MKKFLTKKTIIWAIVVIVGGLIVYNISKPKPAPSLITVSRGDISEKVIVTGNTAPISNTDLAFQVSGKVASVQANVGDKVASGEVLATLDASQLNAQLAQAQASVDAAQAKLDSLKKGTRPEDIQITQTQIAKAQQDLANDYNGAVAVLGDAYSKANDAVRNQANALFINADMNNPQLSFTVTNSQTQIDAQSQRLIAGTELNAWKDEISALAAGTPSRDALDAAIKNAPARLTAVATLLGTLMSALVNTPSLNATTLTAYKTSMTSAESETATATTNVNNLGQAIASQKIVVKQNQDQLALQMAGSTPEDLHGQEATVAQAQANVASVQAQLAQTVVRSPINGTVTKQDAKVGQIASPNTILISVISLDNLEIDSNVPEVDIGKIAVSNPVSITLDAFPGETFGGKVVKIDPAETVIGGVVNFKVTINFEKADARIRSGLTANLKIETRKKTGVLILPPVAIIQNDSGTFAQKYENGAQTQVPIALGIRDENGNVEVTSGVNEGDQLVNIGLKTQ